MLQDRRAAALVDSFAMRWLNVDDLKAVNPDANIFRGFTEDLRRDFSTEIRMYLSEVLLENHSILDLLNADYTFLNQRLASHYGIRGVTGQQFRRVQLTDQNRFGLLGKAAVLLRTSYADRTSPVLRGAWILERIIGTPPTPPPPGVETNLAAPEGQQPTTLRERLEKHRAVQSCNQCHGVIDPLYRVLGSPRVGGGTPLVAYNGTGSVNGGAYDFVVCRPNTSNAQNRAVLVEANGTISTQRRPPAVMAVTCP
jgi:hypothetical protein